MREYRLSLAREIRTAFLLLIGTTFIKNCCRYYKLGQIYLQMGANILNVKAQQIYYTGPWEAFSLSGVRRWGGDGGKWVKMSATMVG